MGNDGVLRTFSSAPALVHTSPSCGAYLFCLSALTGASAHQLAAGSDDGVVRIWAVSGSGLQCVQELRLPGEVYALCALPMGELLISADEAGAYVFTRRPTRAADVKQQRAIQAAAEAFGVTAGLSAKRGLAPASRRRGLGAADGGG